MEPTMPLTDTAIKKVKPGEKPLKLSDDRGMYLLYPRTTSCTAGSVSKIRKNW
jgi:hypothetical protein